ncbi:MAG: hypothetical protein ACRCXX_13860 [Cetobacterium sp.]|uniref:hypothetical protein n=1 Tax=Cetobacterium sp. TaxID=2071632 RepID=UPI003F2C9FB4
MSLKQKKIEEYIERGRKYVKPGFEEEWDKMVNIRVKDIYEGMEVANALAIIESYKEKENPEEIKDLFLKENHSGISAQLVINIINFYIVDGNHIADIIKGC